MQKRIRSFASEKRNGYFVMAVPLIGQLGKNAKFEKYNLIKGDVLLKLAEDEVRQALMILGGRFVYVECENESKLINFYEENGYVFFGKRSLDNDEKDINTSELLQLIKYLK